MSRGSVHGVGERSGRERLNVFKAKDKKNKSQVIGESIPSSVWRGN